VQAEEVEGKARMKRRIFKETHLARVYSRGKMKLESRRIRGSSGVSNHGALP